MRGAAALGALLLTSCAGEDGRAPVPSEQVARLAARVEVARELRFAEPVPAESVTPEGVPRLLAAELDASTPPAQLRRDEALAKALGLLPPDADLRDILLRWQAQAVAGFYSPIDRRLFVVEGAAGAGGGEQASVLVHELAHALQDQHTRLLDARAGLVANDDLQFALGAFLEGDALWTELRDEALLTGFPQARGSEFAARFAVDAPEGEGVPRILRESFLRQYPLGYALADELVVRGGVGALTAALADPPLSSEELLHRERYLVRSARRPLAWLPEEPPLFEEAACEVRATSSYGELGFGVWLADAGVAPAAVARAADGWDGDRAWLLACEEGEALAWLVLLDADRDADEAGAAVAEALPRREGAWRLDREGPRVLLSQGLARAGREALLRELAPRRYEGLGAVLRDRPEILARAARLRRGR